METATLGMGISPAVAGLLGGMTGGVAQAYATMGELWLFITSCDAYDFFPMTASVTTHNETSN